MGGRYALQSGRSKTHLRPPEAAKCNRTGSQTPMQWKKGKNLGFSEGREEDLYLPVDRSENAPTVEEQLADANSLLHMVRKLVTLRKTSDALGSDGVVEFLNQENHGYPLVYTRTDGWKLI